MNKKITNDIDMSMQDMENLAKKSQKILMEQTGCLLKTSDPSVIDICTSEIISAKFDRILHNFLGNFRSEVVKFGKNYEAYESHMAVFLPKISSKIEEELNNIKKRNWITIIVIVLINIFIWLFVLDWSYNKGIENGYWNKEKEIVNTKVEALDRTISQNNIRIIELMEKNDKLNSALERYIKLNNRTK